jgi:hypothetical protein
MAQHSSRQRNWAIAGPGGRRAAHGRPIATAVARPVARPVVRTDWPPPWAPAVVGCRALSHVGRPADQRLRGCGRAIAAGRPSAGRAIAAGRPSAGRAVAAGRPSAGRAIAAGRPSARGPSR